MDEGVVEFAQRRGTEQGLEDGGVAHLGEANDIGRGAQLVGGQQQRLGHRVTLCIEAGLAPRMVGELPRSEKVLDVPEINNYCQYL